MKKKTFLRQKLYNFLNRNFIKNAIFFCVHKKCFVHIEMRSAHKSIEKKKNRKGNDEKKARIECSKSILVFIKCTHVHANITLISMVEYCRTHVPSTLCTLLTVYTIGM